MKSQEAEKNVLYLPVKETWECQFCGETFSTKKEGVEHILKECEMIYE